MRTRTQPIMAIPLVISLMGLILAEACMPKPSTDSGSGGININPVWFFDYEGIAGEGDLSSIRRQVEA